MARQNKVTQAEQITVRRSDIHAAPYNPRKITPEAAKLLKDNLKRVGLLGGIVWNRTTGNLVSGHQKVAQMDAINRFDPNNPDTDYEFRVEVVDFDEKTEKEQNLFMNNRNAQGEYDDDMLRTMLAGIDYTAAGFDDFDAQLLGVIADDTTEAAAAFADTQWREGLTTGVGYGAEEGAKTNQTLADKSAAYKEAAEDKAVDRSKNFYEDTPENQLKRHAEIQKIKDRIINQNDISKDGGTLSYVTLSFQTPDEAETFLAMFSYPPQTRYINGGEFIQRLEFGDSEE